MWLLIVLSWLVTHSSRHEWNTKFFPINCRIQIVEFFTGDSSLAWEICPRLVPFYYMELMTIARNFPNYTSYLYGQFKYARIAMYGKFTHTYPKEQAKHVMLMLWLASKLLAYSTLPSTKHEHEAMKQWLEKTPFSWRSKLLNYMYKKKSTEL